MPNSLVKSLAKKTGKSISEVEKAWDRAKVIITKGGTKKNDPSFFPQVISVTKNLIKKESSMHLRYGDISDPKKSDLLNPEKFRKKMDKRDKQRGIKRTTLRKPAVEDKKKKKKKIYETSLTFSILKELE